jgi:TatD DNase family protein
MRFVDAHVHLSDPEYEPHVDEVVKEAKKANVIALVSNSINLKTSLENMRLAEKHRSTVYAALGIHPWNVKELSKNELEETVKLIMKHEGHESLVAVGEIGLDCKYAKGGTAELMQKQYEVLCKMLQVSEKLSLPAIVHSRGATQEIMDILSSYNIKKVLLHWFSSPIELLPKIVERGYFITEGPATLFSDHVQEIVRQIPLTNLLTETDGPVRFLKPPFKGEMTTPAAIPLVVEAIAKIRKTDHEKVAEQILENFETFFDLKLG